MFLCAGLFVMFTPKSWNDPTWQLFSDGWLNHHIQNQRWTVHVFCCWLFLLVHAMFTYKWVCVSVYVYRVLIFFEPVEIHNGNLSKLHWYKYISFLLMYCWSLVVLQIFCRNTVNGFNFMFQLLPTSRGQKCTPARINRIRANIRKTLLTGTIFQMDDVPEHPDASRKHGGRYRCSHGFASTKSLTIWNWHEFDWYCNNIYTVYTLFKGTISKENRLPSYLCSVDIGIC